MTYEDFQELATYRAHAERVEANWPDFLQRREEMLMQAGRFGGVPEKAAETIMGALLTDVLSRATADELGMIRLATEAAVLRAWRSTDRPVATDAAARFGLSKRELEVLLMVARGMSNQQIAVSLHLSEATIKRHLANIYPRIRVSSRGEAVRKALSNRWITARDITGGEEQEV